jgi:hypothetical protein
MHSQEHLVYERATRTMGPYFQTRVLIKGVV